MDYDSFLVFSTAWTDAILAVTCSSWWEHLPITNCCKYCIVRAKWLWLHSCHKNRKLLKAARQDCPCTQSVTAACVGNQPEVSSEFSHNCLLPFFFQYSFTIPFTFAFYGYYSPFLFSLFFTRLKPPTSVVNLIYFNVFLSVSTSNPYPISHIPMFLLLSLPPTFRSSFYFAR